MVARREVGAVPAAHELEIVPAEGRAQRLGRPRVGVAKLGAGKTGGAHLAQDDVERHIAGEVVEIIVAPDDRVGADLTAGEHGGDSGNRGNHQ
jgi:hypothetical protein